MISLRSSILATLNYYDILDYPLTLLEVRKFLINPGRIIKIIRGVGDVGLDKVSSKLNELVKSGVVSEKNGFYFLGNKSYLYDLRIEREKISSQKWKKFLKLSLWLEATPYLRGVFASGSMALGNTTEDSDFDVLIIIKRNRLYTCRAFLWCITSLLRARRKRYDKIAPNKFCFNHYIGDDNLYLAHESLFNAQTYIHLKPVYIEHELAEKFYASNIWINNFVYNFQPQYHFVRRSIESNFFLKSIARIGEYTLNSLFGDWLENVLKKYQQKRINQNPATHESGGRVIFNDKELEFHPHSFEKVFLEKYKAGLKKLGITPYIEERDSGLIK
jgi:predicted nucleotidyltransferase